MACQCSSEYEAIRQEIQNLTEALGVALDDSAMTQADAMMRSAIVNALISNTKSWEAIGRIASNKGITISEELFSTVARIMEAQP